MLDALRHVLEAEPGVAYALLFGSGARGTAHPGSDADVAVELTAGASRDVQALGGLAARLESAAARRVDLVLLDEAPAPLAYRIFRDGRLIVERDHAALVARKAVCRRGPARRRSPWSIARSSPRRSPLSATPPRACAPCSPARPTSSPPSPGSPGSSHGLIAFRRQPHVW